MKTNQNFNGNDKILIINKENFITFSTQKIQESLENLSKKKGKANIALSGGSTPLPILSRLKEIPLNWDKFNFFIVDERVVEIDSDESNYKNINNVFFEFISSTSFPVLKKGKNLDQMLLEYKNDIKKHLTFNKKGTPIFDLVILGMGTDGHMASLFPETLALLEKKDFLAINFVPKLKSNRITLTIPVLLNAVQTFVMINGDEKKRVFNQIFKGKGEQYPISKLKNSNLYWIIGS